jgi:hypothetical protein
MDPIKFNSDIEKIQFIQEKFQKLINTKGITLNILALIPLAKLVYLSSPTIIDLIIDDKLKWEELIELSDKQLKIICSVEIVELIADEVLELEKLLNLPKEKFELLEDSQLVELLHQRKVTVDEIEKIELETLILLLEFENLGKPLENGYTLIDLATKYQEDPLHITCLTEDDLTDLVLDRAPDVPKLIIEYAIEEDVDFSWVREQLCLSDQILFDETLASSDTQPDEFENVVYNSLNLV